MKMPKLTGGFARRGREWGGDGRLVAGGVDDPTDDAGGHGCGGGDLLPFVHTVPLATAGLIDWQQAGHALRPVG
jgi:hypothetical protein